MFGLFGYSHKVTRDNKLMSEDQGTAVRKAVMDAARPDYAEQIGRYRIAPTHQIAFAVQICDVGAGQYGAPYWMTLTYCETQDEAEAFIKRHAEHMKTPVREFRPDGVQEDGE